MGLTWRIMRRFPALIRWERGFAIVYLPIRLSFTAVLLIVSNQPAPLYVLALVSAAGVRLILMAINAVILLIILRRDGRAGCWRDTVTPLTIALFLAVAQVTAVSWLRLTTLGTISGFPGL